MCGKFNGREKAHVDILSGLVTRRGTTGIYVRLSTDESSLSNCKPRWLNGTPRTMLSKGRETTLSVADLR